MKEDVVIAVDSWDILSKFVKPKKILIDQRKEIYTKSLKLMISPSPYSRVEEIFPPQTLSSEVFDWKGFLSILVPLGMLQTEQPGRRLRRRNWNSLQETPTESCTPIDPMSHLLLLVSLKLNFVTKINVATSVLLLWERKQGQYLAGRPQKSWPYWNLKSMPWKKKPCLEIFLCVLRE